MAAYIGSKTAKQCKSKFQKLQKVIYISQLEVPPIRYQLFLQVKQQRFLSRCKKITKSRQTPQNSND